jgi:hypothetical protein
MLVSWCSCGVGILQWNNNYSWMLLVVVLLVQLQNMCMLVLLTFKALTTTATRRSNALAKRTSMKFGIELLRQPFFHVNFRRCTLCPAPPIWNNLPQNTVSDPVINLYAFKWYLKASLHSLFHKAHKTPLTLNHFMCVKRAFYRVFSHHLKTSPSQKCIKVMSFTCFF